jgi:hypothetical protein
MEISRPITEKIMTNGNTFQVQWKTLHETPAHTNDIKIFSKICPDSMFANNRIAKLNIRDIYDTYSIKIKNGVIKSGTPSGKNRAKNDCLK